MATASAKLEWIGEWILNGGTVVVQTHLRAWSISPKTAARWADAGDALFRVSDSGSLYMRRGKVWDCIDHARLTGTL